jgi:hypothetical protein
MTVPQKLVGAWRRAGVLIGGTRIVEEFDRLWLQTPEWFADIRLRIDPSRGPCDEGLPVFLSQEGAAAGTTSWAEPIITWDKSIAVSARPPGSDDSRPLTWADGVVQESGMTLVHGQECHFIEEWLRMTDDDAAWSTDVGDRRVRVEVGRWAIEVSDDRPVGAFTATRFERTDGKWRPVGTYRVEA